MNQLFLVGLAFVLLGCGVPSPVENDDPDPREQFRGRWRLHKIERLDNDRWQVVPGAEGRQGFILYDGWGGMGVHHVPAGYDAYELESPRPVDSLTRNDLEHLAGQFIYFGRYSLDTINKVITHHIETDKRPSWWGREASRRYVFQGDTLQLFPTTSDPAVRISWIKVNDR